MTSFSGQSYIGNVPLYGDLPQAELVSDGTRTRFDLVWKPGCVQGIYVWVGGVLQTPHRAYHLEEQTIVFHNAPSAGLPIVVRGVSHEVTISVPAKGSIQVDQFARDPTARQGILSYLIESLALFDELTIALQRLFIDVGALRWSLSSMPKPGWLRLDDPDQDLSIKRYADLYKTLSVLGLITSGSDGRHFKFIDLRERFLVMSGQNLTLGSVGGQVMQKLTRDHLPKHDHEIGGTSGVGVVLGKVVKGHDSRTHYHTEWAVDVFNKTGKPQALALYRPGTVGVDGTTTTSTGRNQAFDQRPPYLTGHLHIFAGA